jgi:hypothetical protein
MTRVLSILVYALSLTACAATPPPRWEAGGARLMVARAYWERGDFDRIEIRDDGGVYEGEYLVFTIDRVGRVVDEEYEPVGLMYEDGLLLGSDEAQLGRVGMYNASAPGKDYAWLSVAPDGSVTFFDEDGEQQFGGKWYGCTGPMTRTCTLVTHVFMLRAYLARRQSGPSLGFGVGVGL